MRKTGDPLTANGERSGFSIGEVARAIGLSAQTLRLWEREGLVKPWRTDQGRRVYDEADIERLKHIKRLRASEGLPFRAIHRRLNDGAGAAYDRQPGGDTMSGALGARLRRLRRTSRKTLKEVAAETGLSISFISTLERGGTGASVASLRTLAKVYGSTVRAILDVDLQQSVRLVRPHERSVMRWDNGVRFEGLAVGETVMDPCALYAPPQAGSDGFYAHNGEEVVHVTAGQLFIELKGEATYSLEPGDTLYFPSTIPHRWWAGHEDTRAFWVNTPPTF